MLDLAKTPPNETQGARKRLAAVGNALKDGSFPIPNVAYLKKAIRAVGRAAPGKRPALAKLIRKRGRELGAMNVVKGSWADNTQSATAMSNALRAQLELSGFDPKRIQREVELTRQAFAVYEFAYDPDNDNDDDSSPSGDTDKDYAGSPLYKKVFAAMKKRGMSDASAAKMAMNAVKLKNRKKKAPAGKA